MQTKDNTGIAIPLLRGDVYLVNLDPIVGKEIGKARPAVIIQNDIGNEYFCSINILKNMLRRIFNAEHLKKY